jgi:hypothetical protein
MPMLASKSAGKLGGSCPFLGAIDGDPGLDSLEWQKGTLEPARADSRMEHGQQGVVRQVFHLPQRSVVDQFGQDGRSSAADDAGIAAKPGGGDPLLGVDLQLNPDAVAAQGIDVLVGHIGNGQGAIVTRVTKVVEDGRTILPGHALPC